MTKLNICTAQYFEKLIAKLEKRCDYLKKLEHPTPAETQELITLMDDIDFYIQKYSEALKHEKR